MSHSQNQPLATDRTSAPRTTGYLSASAAARLVRSIGIRACLEGIATRIESDFLRWPEFQKTARIANHCPDGVIELMPVCDSRSWSFKYVNGHPRNFRLDRPTVMAFGALARVDSGEPEFLSELTLTTAMRTAAMSALAARRLARPASRTMALIGNGSQSEFQALAFHFMLGVRRLRLFDVDARATRKLAENLRSFDLEMIACRSVAEACKGADIITTVTADTRRAALVTDGMVEAGMHINAVGGDSPGKTELAPEVLRNAGVFVEFEPQTRIEGEIQQMAPDFPVTELWRVLSGAARGRAGDDQVTIFDSVGFALEDFSALHFMREHASRLGLLAPLDLIPSLQDPKDLFALIGSEPLQNQAQHQAQRPEQQPPQQPTLQPTLQARPAGRHAEVLVQ
jgi:ornithine cyclodeaminase